LISALFRLPASGSTPLQESMYEAYSYFAGNNPPSEDSILEQAAANSTDYAPTGLSDVTSSAATDSLAINPTTGDYISPIKSQCQDNNVILFSDGEPTSDQAYAGDIRTFSGLTCGSDSGECLDELAAGMASKKVNTALDRDNRVYTHTISFASEIDILQDAANAGLRPGADQDSQGYIARNSEQLVSSFQSIISSIKNVDSDSFVAPAVSVNAFNRISNNDELFYAVFEPEANPRWNGNVKKYRLSADGKILDKNGNEAIDDTTGFFVDTAQSFWSADRDGLEVTKGGFAEQLDITAKARNLYAITTLNTKDPETLSDATDFLDAVNTNLIELGAIAKPDIATNKNNIIQWALGKDIEQDRGGLVTDPNYYVGESLHSTPAVVSFGTNKDDPKSVVFTATNQGMLHAIDSEDGEELWSYIPDRDLFENLGVYFNRQDGEPHKYGLDGEMTVDIVRDPESKKVTTANLFMGQRRGGSKYFAIDVLGTSPKSSASGPVTGLDPVVDENGVTRSPVKKLWTKDPTDTGFERLGQTWAKPVPLVVKYCTSANTGCKFKKALALAGGYDPEKYDNDKLVSSVTGTSDATKAKGNDIYIVERDTGNLLWKASSASFPASGDKNKMIHSFPSSPTVVDSNFDGVADLLLATDISGQIWRFDFRGYVEIDSVTKELKALDDSDIIKNGGNEQDSDGISRPSVIGGIIADLSEGVNKSRRFYNRLSVSLTPTIKDEYNNILEVSKYNIVLGSGYRAHPLSEERYPAGAASPTENRIYVVYDRNIQFPKPVTDASDAFTGDLTYKYDSGSIIASGDIPELTSTLDVTPSGTNYHGFVSEQ